VASKGRNDASPVDPEESVTTSARGVGEIRRAVSNQFPGGRVVAVLEMKLVETPPAEPKEAGETELKGEKVTTPRE
jgi:hypothetical protein